MLAACGAVDILLLRVVRVVDAIPPGISCGLVGLVDLEQAF